MLASRSRWLRPSLAICTCLLLGACGSKVDNGGEDAGATPDVEPKDTGTVTTGRTLTKLRVTSVDKLDLLLVIDNSISMADKQSELGRRLPELIAALTDPTPDPKTGKPSNLHDLHVGVISSSLGSHGTSACAVEITNKHNNDKGHLLPRAGEGGGAGCPAPVAASAITWTSGAPDPGLATSCVVQSVKDDGCGYEETWESAYHFLVDPAPYAKAEVKCTFGISGDACGNNKVIVEGLDEELLAQRKAFLRPDSLLAVVVLSDENDASLKPAGLNWLPWGYGKGQLQRGWASCATVPDEFEPETAADFTKLHNEYKCFSCFEDASDPNCKVKWATDPLNNDVDGRNVRAFHMTQRLGYNFLWGRQRYVDAFTKATVFGSDNKLAANPIFAGGRDASMVVVAAIVGVPKGLVTNSDGTPKVMTEADWEKVVGPIGKRDVHMIESIAPRAGVTKFAGDRSIDPINGGDRDVLDGDDLQYACIAPRTEKGKGNECDGPSPDKKNPLCAADGTQPYFKAYPGLRHLRIVKDLGVSGFVASICNDTYRPAVLGITDKVKGALNSQCLRTYFSQDPTGAVKALLFESMKDGAAIARCEDIPGLCTPGAAPCRTEGTDFPPIPPERAAAEMSLPITVVGADGVPKSVSTQAVVEAGNVWVIGADSPSPRKHLVCELLQLSGPSLTMCTTNKDFSLDPAKGGGWCYSSKADIVGDQCKSLGSSGTLRFFGGTEPRSGSEVFVLAATP